MSQNYYLTKSGTLRRFQNTLQFVISTEDGKETVNKITIPIEDIESLLLFGEITINTKAIDFLAKAKIPFHAFNYYGYYSGTFFPREYLVSGDLLIKQVNAFTDMKKRLELSKELIDTASHNIIKVLKYYHKKDKEFGTEIQFIENLKKKLPDANSIQEIMGLEGNIRKKYYQSWNKITGEKFQFQKRIKNPPDSAINALISFVNSLVYTTCLGEIYRTQLNPTISFLHQPQDARFSLSLDLAEVFKPILADRLILPLINLGQIHEKHFDKELNFCYLNDAGRRIVLKAFDEKLKTIIHYPPLKRSVSYRRLIRIEAYKWVKYLIEGQTYKGLKSWW